MLSDVAELYDIFLEKNKPQKSQATKDPYCKADKTQKHTTLNTRPDIWAGLELQESSRAYNTNKTGKMQWKYTITTLLKGYIHVIHPVIQDKFYNNIHSWELS